MPTPTAPTHRPARLTFALHLCAAMLLGATVSALPAHAATEAPAAKSAAASKKAAPKPAAKSAAKKDPAKAGTKAAGSKTGKGAGKAAAKEDTSPGTLADFGKVDAPEDVVKVANWVSWSRNSKKKAFVIIDKKMARLYVFDPKGKLKSDTPILLGKASGDDTAPGVADKPLSALKEEEKTTPAGRFLVQPGKNNHGEDILWIDYNAAVSMHRLRKVKEEERRYERMATPEIDDNRISNGCVNVPHAFYNTVLKPTVTRYGAFVYVLPETRSLQQQFGNIEVPASAAAAPKGKSAA